MFLLCKRHPSTTTWSPLHGRQRSSVVWRPVHWPTRNWNAVNRGAVNVVRWKNVGTVVDGLGPDDCDGGDGPEVLDLLDVVNAFLRRIEKIRFRDSKILNRRKGALNVRFCTTRTHEETAHLHVRLKVSNKKSNFYQAFNDHKIYLFLLPKWTRILAFHRSCSPWFTGYRYILTKSHYLLSNFIGKRQTYSSSTYRMMHTKRRYVGLG